MKTLLLIFTILFISAPVYAATIDVTPIKRPISADGQSFELEYSGATVAASGTQEYALTFPSKIGTLKFIKFNCATGTSSALWTANKTGETQTGVSRTWTDDDCNLSCVSSSPLESDFYNQDTPQENTHYFTIKNNDTVNATGAWSLVIIMKGVIQ